MSRAASCCCGCDVFSHNLEVGVARYKPSNLCRRGKLQWEMFQARNRAGRVYFTLLIFLYVDMHQMRLEPQPDLLGIADLGTCL